MSDIDVLVVGSGAAGLIAAAAAARAGQTTVLLTKGQVGRSGATATITGDCCVDGRTCVDLLGLKADRQDSEDAFFEDTIRGGKYLNDQKLAETMISEIGPIVKDLRDTGLKIADPIRSPGHRTERGVWMSGMELMQTLRKLNIRSGVKVREEFFATDVLTDDGVATGIAGIDQRTGDILCFEAKATIVATGGGMMIYPLQTAPEELTGDGHSLLLRAGARLMDMEMVQFLPCVLTDPPMWRGIQFPWLLGPQSGIRAWLLNRFGERFMEKWDPINMEFSTRDIISIACMKEVLAGRGGPNGGVFLSWAHLPSNIIDFSAEWFFRTHMRGHWRWEGFDFADLIEDIKKGHAIEVISASHFFMGGAEIDRDGATAVPGLYAAGEVAGGVHGANRLSGNAGSQILVQGQRAGEAAASFSKRAERRVTRRAGWDRVREELEAPLKRDEGVLPIEIKDELQNLANIKVGIVRTNDSLEQALDGVRRLRREELPRLYCHAKQRRYNKEWADAIECRSMIETLEATALCALMRRESRGAHFRDDFPEEDTAGRLWNGLLSLKSGELSHDTQEVVFHRLAPGAA